jgi:hypothetical protein
LNGIGYAILEHSLINVNGRDTAFSKALGFDAKGYFSLLLYVVAIVSAFFSTLISDAIIITVAIMWFIPDRRFEPLIDLNRKYAINAARPRICEAVLGCNRRAS